MTATTMNKLATILPILVNDDVPVMLWGPAGVGKTEIVDQVAASLNWPLVDWRTNLRDPVDARGLPMPDLKAGNTRWLRPDELPFVGNDKFADDGILRLDEINTGSPAMQNVCLQLVLERCVGEHKLKPGWRIIATGNRVKDRGNVIRMGMPLKNRFAHFEIEPDVESIIAHGIKIGIDSRLLAFFRFRKQFLHMPPANDDVNAFPSPRQWFQNVARYLNQPRDIRPVIVEAFVGKEPAVELEGFLRVFNELPDLQAIVTDPSGARVPGEPAAKYAVAMMIAREATLKIYKPIVEYAQRLGRELEMLSVLDSVRFTPGLANTSTYGQFAIRNQAYLL
jgi:hypothetical protein